MKKSKQVLYAEKIYLFISKFTQWFLVAFFLAPSPFYMCFDGCASPSLILPLILVWVPILTVFSLFYPLTWVWHFIMMVPFMLFFYYLKSYINSKYKNNKKLAYFIAFIVYWLILCLIWLLIPSKITMFLLQQQH